MSQPEVQRAGVEELSIIRDKIVLDKLRIMVELNFEGIKESAYVLNRLFGATTQIILARINTELSALYKELWRRKIKIIGEEQANGMLYYRFICRGYEDRYGIIREALRSEISIRLGKLIFETMSGGEEKRK